MDPYRPPQNQHHQPFTAPSHKFQYYYPPFYNKFIKYIDNSSLSQCQAPCPSSTSSSLPRNTTKPERPWKVNHTTFIFKPKCQSLVLLELSQMLNCGLDMRTLTLLVALIEQGVNPEALANVVKELSRETRALRVG